MTDVMQEHQPLGESSAFLKRGILSTRMTSARSLPVPARKSGPRPIDLMYGYFQATTSVLLVDDTASFARTLFGNNVRPRIFWLLHASATLTAIGDKARPVACRDVLRRIMEVTFCR